MSMRVSEVAQIMGGERVLGRRVQTTEDLRQAVEEGLPVAALTAVARHVAGPGRAAGEFKYRLVPRATLHRRRERLTLEESERVERLARITAMAEQVWETPALAHEYLCSPQPMLDGKRPVDLARTDLGARQVEEQLLQLEYSLPA